MNHPLEVVQEQFTEWRNQKRKIRQPIPDSLWQAAIALIPNYTKSEIVRTLGLNYSALKQRLEERNATRSDLVPTSEPQAVRLIEVDVSSALPSCQSHSIFCDRIDVERRDGSRLSLYAKEGHSLDGIVLLKTFLEGHDATSHPSK